MRSSACIITGVYIDELVTVHKICVHLWNVRWLPHSFVQNWNTYKKLSSGRTILKVTLKWTQPPYWYIRELARNRAFSLRKQPSFFAPGPSGVSLFCRLQGIRSEEELCSVSEDSILNLRTVETRSENSPPQQKGRKNWRKISVNRPFTTLTENRFRFVYCLQ